MRLVRLVEELSGEILQKYCMSLITDTFAVKGTMYGAFTLGLSLNVSNVS